MFDLLNNAVENYDTKKIFNCKAATSHVDGITVLRTPSSPLHPHKNSKFSDDALARLYTQTTWFCQKPRQTLLFPQRKCGCLFLHKANSRLLPAKAIYFPLGLLNWLLVKHRKISYHSHNLWHSLLNHQIFSLNLLSQTVNSGILERWDKCYRKTVSFFMKRL